MTNKPPTEYPADPFNILPEEWRARIKAAVRLDGEHWIWQNSTRDANGNFTINDEGRNYAVAKKLFNLVFRCDEKTKKVCDVECCIGPLCQRSTRMTPEERYAKFLTKVTKPNANGCTYYIDDKKVRNVLTDDGTTRDAHVYVCDHVNPETKNHPVLTHVGHSCLSPVDENGYRRPNTCVTETHVKRVTPQQNAAKKKIDGTMRFGDRNHSTKIPDAEIPKILARKEESAAALAKEYGVSAGLIYGIRSGKYRLGLTNPQAVERQSATARKGKAIPDKDDFLVAYFNLCCHQLQYSSCGCIETNLATDSDGYSMISIAGRRHTVPSLIASIKNNFSLVSAVGLEGCHERHCMKKEECTGFDHIRCGTRSSNAEDRVSDERREKVRSIFAAFQAGKSKKDIAAMFGENYCNVVQICNGTTHSSITGLSRRITKKEAQRQMLVVQSVKSSETTMSSSTATTTTSSTAPKVSTVSEIVPRRLARDRLALEIIYSAQSGLTVAERAAKYGKSIQFLTELDKALAFQQLSATQNDARAPFLVGDPINAMKISEHTQQSIDQNREEKTKKRKESSSLDEILENVMKKRKLKAGIIRK